MTMLVLLTVALFAGNDEPATATLRVATFNIWELDKAKIDDVNTSGQGVHPQLRGAAEIIQHIRPDILLVNEIDYTPERNLAADFRDRYLRFGQNDLKPIDFPHIFYEAVNTGLPTGLDLDNDGRTDGPGDAHGWGNYPGQYGMALFSRYPIDAAAARTFQKFLWKDMPGNLLPDGSRGTPEWYTADKVAILRLSSKSHWDVPIRINDITLHALCAHPTPPVFDGDEDRNGRRNFDEIRFWVDYLSQAMPASLSGPSAQGAGPSTGARSPPPSRKGQGEGAGPPAGAGPATPVAPQPGAYIVDDQGRRGPLPRSASFVILGDLNSDPARADTAYGTPAIIQLIEHPRVQDPVPTSLGPLGKNQPGLPYHLERKTSDFGRLDYALCSEDLKVTGSGVFWPAPHEPLHHLVSDRTRSSDHRLVWVDFELPQPENQ